MTEIKQEYNLKKKYNDIVRGELMKEFAIKNVHAIPNLEKIVINVGLGEAKLRPEIIDEMKEDITKIAGQKPIVTRTKKAISNFKIRENMPIGLKVTLRGDNMWNFLDKLVNIVLPRIKDFRGIPDRAFDRNGNYALGIKDHLIFPEIDTSKVVKSRPLQVIINTTTNDDKIAFEFLKKLGLPFIKRKQ